MRERAIGGSALAAAAVLLWAAAACSGGGDGDDDGATGVVVSSSTAPPTTAEPPPCSESRYAVVFDINGTITASIQELPNWLNDPSYEPKPRELAPELARAYQERGYELWYVTALPGSHMIGDQPATEALTEWLGDNGFPMAGARVELSETPNPATELSNDLLSAVAEGVTLRAAYTDKPDDVRSFQVAGVEEVYLLSDDVSAASLSTSIPGGDLAGELERVESLPPICTP
ncbi:MAG TPA: hypothetical protein VIL36_21975 [Acidimicrobiales bacterium]